MCSWDKYTNVPHTVVENVANTNLVDKYPAILLRSPTDKRMHVCTLGTQIGEIRDLTASNMSTNKLTALNASALRRLGRRDEVHDDSVGVRLESAARAAREAGARLAEERLVRVARVAYARQVDDRVGEEVGVEEEDDDCVDERQVLLVLATSLHVDDNNTHHRKGEATEEAGDEQKRHGDEGFMLHADVE